MNPWSTYDDFFREKDLPTRSIVLASGSPVARNQILAKLGPQHDIFMFGCTAQFDKISLRDTFRLTRNIINHATRQGLVPLEVNHSDFGGATNAAHLILYKGLDLHGFEAPPAMPRTLSHLLDAATRGRFMAIERPCDLGRPVARTPITVDGMLRREGLFDVHCPHQEVACPSVFSPTKWIVRKLTCHELLRVFDIPLSMDAAFRTRQTQDMVYTRPANLACAITPLVVTAIFRDLWGVKGGLMNGSSHALGQTMSQSTIKAGDVLRKDNSENEEEENKADILREESPITQASVVEASSSASDVLPSHGWDLETYESFLPGKFIHIDFAHIKGLMSPPEKVDLASCSFSSAKASDSASLSESSDRFTTAATQARLNHIKEEHDLAKAVKSDDAPVPMHVWDRKVFHGPPTPLQAKALTVAREGLLRHYRRHLLRDVRVFLQKAHGDRWYEADRSLAGPNLKLNLDAARDILWRSTQNDWFEYPMGSRLKFFRYPLRYRNMARDGVPILFNGPRPTSKHSQSTKMKPEEKAILRKKLLKNIEKRYLSVPDDKLESWIKYFGVPKGILNGVVQDWRVVYHAGANGLNDCVWAPPFGLPKIDSLLRIVDLDSVMQDRDIGEMFLNFELHPTARKYTGVDVRPLDFTDSECMARLLWWTKNLMGFSPSPYNSVKMYLISEEIIRGDRHDSSNAFQWNRCLLNLPGTKEYKPSIAWISKRRSDNSLASDFVCFIDDQRLAGSTPARIIEAGHALSSRESYLGIQDALRKLRAPEGTKYPGAWAGAVVFNDEEEGVVVLTSQEKWDQLKQICRHWLAQLENSNTTLDHKVLRSDRGFLVYVTQAYPCMVPYLKGIHLSLETWRGGRDEEGWKNKAPDLSGEESEGIEDEEVTLFHEKEVDSPPPDAPLSGTTQAVPRLREDLEALLFLSSADKPRYRIVRGKVVMTAYYGFGDASSGGFGATVERPDGIHGRFGLWSSDEDDVSSNFRELFNLVQTVEEEALAGHLKHTELWLFTDNSTAESCFVKGSSTSKLLHGLILRLRKVEMEYGVTLFLVHCAGIRMIAQGTDGLSRGTLLEGVLAGRDMLSFIDIAKTAVERHPGVLNYINSWAGKAILAPLLAEEWFVEGHGIIGGGKDANGIWIPDHAKNGQTYLWMPPPVIADVALEECMKAVHKRTDAVHIFAIPRLFTPRWTRAFHKLCDFQFSVPVGSTHWPASMHEPLWIGISLPIVNKSPWTLRRTPLLVELARDLREVFASGEGDGRDILRKLLRVPGRIQSVSQRVARGVLHLPRTGTVPNGKALRRAGERMVQTGPARAQNESRDPRRPCLPPFSV